VGDEREDRECPRPPGTIQRRFERLLSASRLLALIPVVFLLIDAAGSFVYGSDILLRTVSGDIGEPSRVGGRLGVFLVVMDTYLVGATLLISAYGFYELFIIRKQRAARQYWLPSWLKMRDLEDLKIRVISMLVLVAAITFVDVLVESGSHHALDTLYLGLGIAVVIVGLTAFLRWGVRHAPATSSGEGSGGSPGGSPAGGPSGSSAEG
jgi:uncharacterized membrane protein YqhA